MTQLTNQHGLGVSVLLLSFGIWFNSAPNAMADALRSSCLSPPYSEAITPSEQRLLGLVTNLRSDIAEFPALSEALEAQGPDICLSDALVLEKAFFEPATNRIVLSEDLENGLARAVLVHELRHVEQFARGICPSDRLSMKDYARAALALEADATTVTLLVTWRLSEAGDAAPWEAIAAWSMTSDIADSFSSVMRNTGNISMAAQASFEQWYVIFDRRERYYIANCSGYLDRQDEAHLIPSYRQVAPDYLEQICVLPDGSSYACSDEVGIRE